MVETVPADAGGFVREMNTWILLDNLAWVFRNDLHISLFACMNTTSQQHVAPCFAVLDWIISGWRGEAEREREGKRRGHACTAPTPRFLAAVWGSAVASNRA